jgi:ParB-like chromosome segregation protein Spo0J
MADDLDDLLARDTIKAPASVELPVHPVAALFPLMTDDELADLAADIKANGLRHPIVLADMIGQDDVVESVIDGRNRLKACLLAGVEPRFERVNGPIGLVRFAISANISRRHMSTGQIAMTLALVRRAAPTAFLPEPEENKPRGRGRPKDPTSPTALARVAGISFQRISEAELIIDYAPDLIDEVKTNHCSLDKAYNTALSRKQAKEWREEGLAKLRKIAPDLAARVDKGELTFEEARTLLTDRDKIEEQRRQTVFQMLGDFARLTNGFANTPLEDVPAWLKNEEHAKEFQRYFKGGVADLENSAQFFQTAVDALTGLIAKLPKEKRRTK